MGNFHHYHHCNPDQPQTRVPFLAGNKGGVESEENYPDYGYDSEYGIGGFACPLNMAMCRRVCDLSGPRLPELAI